MFHSMQYIYEVYKERSFSKAAANLYISQPSLSAAVKKVEEKIGAPIFDRSVSLLPQWPAEASAVAFASPLMLALAKRPVRMYIHVIITKPPRNTMKAR